MSTEWLDGNWIRLLESGADYFPALLADIAAARDEIFLESYIFANDPTGRAVANALCEAARRQVRVNLTVDGFGSRNFQKDFAESFQQAGVRILTYRPEIGTFHLRRHRLRRLHRKLAVIDAGIAYVGGINVVDDNNAPAEMCPRYDYAVRIEGPLLSPIHHAMRHMWEIVTWANFKRRYRLDPPLTPCCQRIGTQQAAFLIRDNFRHRHDILNAYLEAIREARDEIIIANAYFLPGIRFGRALQAAARRGVRITVLLQGKTDHPLLRYATQHLYDEALGLGIRVFEYEKSMMHAKVAVIDGAWATVGSSNIDPFSLLLAKEANVVIRDRAFAGQLRQSLLTAIAEGAREMSPDDIARQPVHSKILRWLSYGVIRAFVGIAGYGPKHWQADEDQERLRAAASGTQESR